MTGAKVRQLLDADPGLSSGRCDFGASLSLVFHSIYMRDCPGLLSARQNGTLVDPVFVVRIVGVIGGTHKGLGKLGGTMRFPILEKSRGYRLIFAIEFVIVKDLEGYIVPSHIPGQVRCPNSGRQGDGGLIVKFPTQKAIANPRFQKVLDGRTAIKVEIGDMKKSMNGMQLGTGTRVSMVSFRRRGQSPIDNSNTTDGLFKGVVNAIVYSGTLDFAPWKIVKQNGEIVLQKESDGIAIPNSRTKAIGIHPQHGLIRGQCGMRPQVPGTKFRLPIVGNPTRTLGPPR